MIGQFRRIRIRTKLIASYVLLCAAITLTSILVARGFEREVLEASRHRTEVLYRGAVLSSAAFGAAQKTFSFIESGYQEDSDGARAHLTTALEQMRALGSTRLTDEQRRLFAKVEFGIHRLEAQTTEILGRSGQSLWSMPERRLAYDYTIDHLALAMAEFLAATGADSRAELDAVRVHFDLLTVVGLLAAIAGIGAGVLFARRITRPLARLRSAVKAIGTGELDTPIPAGTGDEVGELGATFARMVSDTRQRNEERFEDVFTSIRESLVVCGGDGITAAVNPACLRLFGCEQRELVGKPVDKIFPGAVLASVDTSGAIAVGGAIENDSTIRRADGSSAPVRLSVSRLRGDRRHGWIVVARDLTEQNRLQGELRQAQKMEALGRLAGGVAHDFNNMLSIIIGYTTMVLDEMPEGDPRHEQLTEVLVAGERSAELTHQLLAFSRRQPVETRIVNVTDTIRSTSRMIDRVLGEDVELSTPLTTAVCRVRMEAGQLEQILMNLVVNARDAMPQGGQLTIETSLEDFPDPMKMRHENLHPGRYVLIALSDNGIGMDRATQERIFEPFFTTKEQGKGTGLGLSTVFGIVNQSAGHIYVYSEPGVGTTFKIYLPDAGYGEEASASAPPSPAPPRGSETVLLVEDEDQLRTFVQEVLRRDGYQVLAARGPAEAIDVSERHDGAIDLILTDVVMPGMSGREVADRVRAARPGTKLVYMSGYTDNVVLDRGIGAAAFLQKPITAAALRRKLRAVLDAAG